MSNCVPPDPEDIVAVAADLPRCAMDARRMGHACRNTLETRTWQCARCQVAQYIILDVRAQDKGLDLQSYGPIISHVIYLTKK
jgi:hypothetical protein